MDVLNWDERSVLSDRGLLPDITGELLPSHAPGVDVVDRYRGALVGLAIGDALGKPVSGSTPAEIDSRYGQVNRFLNGPFPALLLPSGQIGTHTQLALALAGSAIHAGRFDPREYAQRLTAWHPIARGAGKTVMDSTRALRNGTSWLQSGRVSAGDGAAARAVPIGLLNPTDLDMLRFDATVQALITHADRTAMASAIVMATAVAHLTSLPDGAFDAGKLFSTIERSLHGFPQPELSLRHVSARSTLLHRISLALDQVGSSPPAGYKAIRTGGFVLESLPAAIWAFASFPENPVGALILAVNGGHAAASVGAMAGALAGAYRGVSNLPAPWVDHLEYADGIAGHADGLLEVSGAGFADEPLFESDLLHPASFSPFQLGGTAMPTLEHAIRSAAAGDPSVSVKLRLLPTPADVRRFASTTAQRPDWETSAAGTVAAILKRRFADHGVAGEQLRHSANAHVELMGAHYREEPFDYAALLGARQATLNESTPAPLV